MQVKVRLNGLTPLVMHNVRLADNLDPYVKLIKPINAKGTRKTDADYAEIERLEWHGGIYHEPGIGVYVPTWNVVRCFERAAAITRNGANIIRAFPITTEKIPLSYAGPQDISELWERPEFRWRTVVGVQRNKISRTRPIFRQWSLTLDAELLEDVMDFDVFESIVHLAGRAEGLGDARKLGYGRFQAEVSQ